MICHMVEAGASFCVRASDAWVRRLLREELPGGEFDLVVERVLARTSSLAARSRPGEPRLYRVFRARRRLDVLAPGSRAEYAVRLRVVRLRLPDRDGDGAGGDRWLNLVTDLGAGEFPPRALADLYAMRWGEEVGFSHLKHVVGMETPRTLDLGRALQEAWGRLVLYDACSLGTSGVPEPADGDEHPRATDRTDAFKCFMDMLRGRVRRAAHDVEAYAARLSHSVRPGRGHPRRKRPKSPPKSGYRH